MVWDWKSLLEQKFVHTGRSIASCVVQYQVIFNCHEPLIFRAVPDKLLHGLNDHEMVPKISLITYWTLNGINPLHWVHHSKDSKKLIFHCCLWDSGFHQLVMILYQQMTYKSLYRGIKFMEELYLILSNRDQKLHISLLIIGQN